MQKQPCFWISGRSRKVKQFRCRSTNNAAGQPAGGEERAEKHGTLLGWEETLSGLPRVQGTHGVIEMASDSTHRSGGGSSRLTIFLTQATIRPEKRTPPDRLWPNDVYRFCSICYDLLESPFARGPEPVYAILMLAKSAFAQQHLGKWTEATIIFAASSPLLPSHFQ